jgi:prepilin-type N-terminal cleavage/methylation domain-containing protein/prepilin-type processing-associated H-X9-DG protein
MMICKNRKTGDLSAVRGFTLVELLVVISIIAILLAVLMPALSKAREISKKTICLSHLRSLTMLVHIYANDNNGKAISGETYKGGWTYDTEDSSVTGISKNQAYYTEEGQVKGIKKGTLWSYANKNLGIYKCPAAKRLVKFAGIGTIEPGEEARNYSMSMSFCYSDPDGIKNTYGPLAKAGLIMKLADAKQPASRFVFIGEGLITPSGFSIYSHNSTFFDPPTMRHGRGSVFSFVDGHTEHWTWYSRKTIDYIKEVDAQRLFDPTNFYGANRSSARNKDLWRLAVGTWGKCSFQYQE